MTFTGGMDQAPKPAVFLSQTSNPLRQGLKVGHQIPGLIVPVRRACAPDLRGCQTFLIAPACYHTGPKLVAQHGAGPAYAGAGPGNKDMLLP